MRFDLFTADVVVPSLMGASVVSACLSKTTTKTKTKTTGKTGW